MVWLHTAGKNLYLDIHRVEQRQEGDNCSYVISATLGDGRDEGEVLVEVGRGVDVTFLDAWLPGRSLPPFLDGAGREGAVRALTAELSAMLFCVESFPSLEGRPLRRVTGFRAEGRWLALRPGHYGESSDLPSGSAEVPLQWQAGAA